MHKYSCTCLLKIPLVLHVHVCYNIIKINQSSKTKHTKGKVKNMKFEVNKRYEALSGSVLTFEIIKRTAKRVTYVEIDHTGRYNERKSEPKTATIKIWSKGEVFITSRGATVTAY